MDVWSSFAAVKCEPRLPQCTTNVQIQRDNIASNWYTNYHFESIPLSGWHNKGPRWKKETLTSAFIPFIEYPQGLNIVASITEPGIRSLIPLICNETQRKQSTANQHTQCFNLPWLHTSNCGLNQTLHKSKHVPVTTLEGLCVCRGLLRQIKKPRLTRVTSLAETPSFM